MSGEWIAERERQAAEVTPEVARKIQLYNRYANLRDKGHAPEVARKLATDEASGKAAPRPAPATRGGPVTAAATCWWCGAPRAVRASYCRSCSDWNAGNEWNQPGATSSPTKP